MSSEEPQSAAHFKKAPNRKLVITALGIVFGDIGTSPTYGTRRRVMSPIDSTFRSGSGNLERHVAEDIRERGRDLISVAWRRGLSQH